MAEKMIINMPPKTTPADTDLIIVEDAADTKRMTWANLVKPIKDMIGNLASLTTNNKTSVVGAINEHLAEDATQTKLGHIKLQEPWKTATLENGWTGTFNYAKNSLGQVTLRGVLIPGTLTAGTVITTLPGEYTTIAHVTIPSYDSSHGIVRIGLVLSTNGQLIIRPPASNESVGSMHVNFIFFT